MKILVTRTDRIGDLVLSTPVFEAIKKHRPNDHLILMAQKGIIDVADNNPFIDEYIAYEPYNSHKGIKGILRLSDIIRRKRIDIAVELFMSFYPALAIMLADIKMRVGPGSRVYSYIFLNHVMKQNRRQSLYNEAAYNLMLLKPLGINELNIKPHVYLSNAKDSCEGFLLNYGIKPFNYFVVHPGMGGSALNWPADNYVSLIKTIVDRYKLPVIVTGTYNDDPFVRGIIAKLSGNIYVKNMCCILSIKQLKTVLFFARGVIAPSTGPMHIAAALGKPTIALFSPIKAQSGTRWSPYLIDNVAIVEPDVKCMERYNCNRKCLHYNCMNMIKVKEVMKKMEALIGI